MKVGILVRGRTCARAKRYAFLLCLSQRRLPVRAALIDESPLSGTEGPVARAAIHPPPRFADARSQAEAAGLVARLPWQDIARPSSCVKCVSYLT